MELVIISHHFIIAQFEQQSVSWFVYNFVFTNGSSLQAKTFSPLLLLMINFYTENVWKKLWYVCKKIEMTESDNKLHCNDVKQDQSVPEDVKPDPSEGKPATDTVMYLFYIFVRICNIPGSPVSLEVSVFIETLQMLLPNLRFYCIDRSVVG